MNPVVHELVRRLRLESHPEGGYYRETFRSPGLVPGKRHGTVRNASTVILFLVADGSCSRIHRLASKEEWVLLSGGPLELVELRRGNGARSHNLDVPGSSHLVPAGTWFGARVNGTGSYALVECRVSPGFDFSDFELAGGDELVSEYPADAETITRLT